MEPRMGQERQGSHDSRSQPRGEEMGIRYEENYMPQSFEGLEQKFLDDIMKLSKEQNDAEDAENARHRERINIINVQYQEQLVALRARHANRREELLRQESHSRQQQYQQDHHRHHHSSSGPNDPRGYSAAPGREPHRPYSADSHNERTRLPGSGRNNEYEPRALYHLGGYSAAPGREPHRPYSADSHNERTRFPGSGRSNEFEHRVQYHGGRGSRYY
ncbi:OLC1v1004817C1 [Oldenlandia corymbosa var. corymbosa]|nr:OLC1v1004817C1 [Oldenlandia corymbosa var. corymbosa]